MEDLKINNDRGVSPVGEDTKLIAKCVAKLKFKTAIDIGTGTGFIPIYLKKLGFECEGTDIIPKALNCAKKNARKNNLDIDFYYSNLFDNVNKKFDIIIFNPPLGSFSSNFLSKYLEIVKSFIPKENKLISKLSFQLVKKQRKKLIQRFLDNFGHFLNKKGRAVVLLKKSELNLVKDFSPKIVGEIDVGNARIVLLSKKELLS